ncbi:MAG TPA: F0F1 ATP synthase subunit B [Gemmatimonadaceae bacterium]|nr:F0F1 ATP synthase subunit B [Gemmatimonadaceae bacterium]
MRSLRSALLASTLRAGLALALVASPVLAQEHEAPKGGLLTLQGGLMFWTLVIFVLLLIVLSRFAFRPITAAVAAREAALEAAINEAKRDRDEASRLLAEQQAALEASRAEAARFLADGRAAGERLRAELLEQARQEQQELLERVRGEIAHERDRAIADLRREAVDLAIVGAGKVIEKNLDDATNRRIVEQFLATVPARRTKG